MKTLLLSLLTLAPAAVLPAADGLGGVWHGDYHYQSDGKEETVHFSLVARHALHSALFSGHVQEPNVFGDPKDLVLEADVHGFVDDDGSVRFVKIYDGHGNQTHTVWYAGKVAANGKTISGKWYVDGAWGGTFTLSYVDRQ